MKFSIIIPVYNVENYVEKCIMSVINQTYADYEVIVVDDGSTDNSSAIIVSLQEKYSHKIRVVRQVNRGQGGARNTGVSYAKGDYLVFIDSDDYIEPNMFAVLAEATVCNEPDMVVFDAYFIDEDGINKKYFDMTSLPAGVHSVAEHPEILLNPPAAWNKIYRRDFFENAGFYYPEKRIYEDTGTTRLLEASAKQILFIKMPLYYYVQRRTSVTHASSFAKMMDVIPIVQEFVDEMKRLEYYVKYYPEVEAVVYKTVLGFVASRISKVDWRSSNLAKLADFVSHIIPELSQNKYMSRNERLKYRLLLRGQYLAFYSAVTLWPIFKALLRL